jgi:hypothetical protein
MERRRSGRLTEIIKFAKGSINTILTRCGILSLQPNEREQGPS